MEVLLVVRGLSNPFSIPFLSLEHMEEKNYDVLVVGTGAGGGAVLWRLCEKWRKNRKSIGVIESGDLLLPTHIHNIPKLSKKWKKHYSEVSNPIGQRLPQFLGAEQVFAVGGRTLFWGAVTPRMHASEFINWPISEQEIDTYYQIAEDIMQIRQASSINSLHLQSILRHLHSKGFHEARPIPSATSHGKTFSSLCFLKNAWKQHPFDFAVKARALQLLMENGKPVGLKVGDHNKKIHVLRAKTIVLAAGSLETPRLLLHSKIPGNTIGHFLTNHSFIKAKGEFISKKFGNISENICILIPQTDETPYQFQIYINKRLINVVGFGKVESLFDNYLTLDPLSVDEYGMPKVKINFSYSVKDMEIIRQMNEALHQVFNVLGARVVHENGKAQIHVMEPGEDYHESGSCRIGNDPSQSATNRYGQIHGSTGLYVADNSILSSIGASNPTLTTVALAIRIADHISNSYSKERTE